MADDMQGKLEKTQYKHAIFTCAACADSRRRSHHDVLQMLLGKAVICPSCKRELALPEADRARLLVQMKRSAGHVRWLLVGAGLYVVLCIGLMMQFSQYIAGLALLAGLLLAWLIHRAASSRKQLELTLHELKRTAGKADLAQPPVSGSNARTEL